MVANADRWITLDAYASCFRELEWKWVKAHVGNHYNEVVDDEARKWGLKMRRR
jgi:ribonuclease HI